MKKFLILLYLQLLCWSSFATNAPRFTLHQTQSYVPYSNINDMFEDDYGFLWIATENSLMKFNGYDYITYKQNRNVENSLPNNNCRKLMEDRKKRLWIGTDYSIAIYNRELDNFKVLPLEELDNHNIVSIIQDVDGSIWIQSFTSLIQLTEEGEFIRSYPYPGGCCMALDGDKIWLGSLSYGLHQFDTKTQKISEFKINTNDQDNHVRSILKTSDNQLFIGTRDMGLIIYNLSTGKYTQYSTNTHPDIFKSDYVMSLSEDNRGNVWIGSVNGQLLAYDLKTKRIQVPNIKYPSGIDIMTIGCVYEDRHENIWVGTHHYWMFKSNRIINEISIFQHQPNIANSLSHNAVTCFAQIGHNLYVGTDGGGLNILDTRTGKFKTEDKLGKIILDIKQGKNPNELWIGTWGNNSIGLACYNTQTQQFKHYTHDPNNPNSISSNSLRSVLVEDSCVWIATDGGGLSKINVITGAIECGTNSKDTIFSPQNPQWVNHLMRDKKGRFWVITSEGVILYEHNNCKRITMKEADNGRIQNEARMIMEDRDGEIWVVTASNGLNKYDEQDSSFVNLSDALGLPTTLSAIVEDNNGNFWISSTDEIIRFNKSNSKKYCFNMKNDLNGNPFTPNAIYKSGNQIYVGSNNGFLQFAPEDLMVEPNQPDVFLKDIYIWGVKQEVSDSTILKKGLAFTDTILLSHNENSLNIDYYAVNLEDPENISYSVWLKGFHNTWQEVGEDRRVSFTNLSPGVYQFIVKATDLNSLQESLSHPLTIIIQSPWWATWWFRILCLLLFAFIFFSFLYMRDKEMQAKQEKLEKIVAERTEELRIKNGEIEKQKENLEIKNQKLDESLSTKNKILSVIAHDLRNPLTAIIGNLSILAENEKGGKAEQKIKQVCKSAENLQTQMENLLDWARLQNQSILYSPKDCFLDALSKECITLLQELFKEKHIQVSLNNEATTSAFIDQRMMSTICRNLINNAIKFTNDGGQIDIRVSESDNHIYWSIRDNGVGMSEEQKEKLFSKDFTSTTFGTKNEKGSGLGLKICHEFILINQGKLKIDSKQGEGTLICISLPKGHLHQEAKNDLHLEVNTDNQNSSYDKKAKLLIVDDNPEILSFLSDLLSPIYEISHANNGEDAFRIAKDEIPDLIISDVVMPKMNGRELCYHIKNESLTKHIPVIMLTSEDTIEDQVQGLNIGADDYITKPFNAEILKAKTATILRNKEMQREHLRSRILLVPEMEIPESQDDAFIHKINDIIKANISESSLTVEFLADKTALSRVQLFRKFKAITGCSPSEYIKAIRLEHAAEIMKKSKQTVADIAYSVGFSDPKYFSSCFSEKFGMTPSQYIKEKAEINAQG